jgi:hypothetical protein
VGRSRRIFDPRISALNRLQPKLSRYGVAAKERKEAAEIEAAAADATKEKKIENNSESTEKETSTSASSILKKDSKYVSTSDETGAETAASNETTVATTSGVARDQLVEDKTVVTVRSIEHFSKKIS